MCSEHVVVCMVSGKETHLDKHVQSGRPRKGGGKAAVSDLPCVCSLYASFCSKSNSSFVLKEELGNEARKRRSKDES